jgi:hypothetical protein
MEVPMMNAAFVPAAAASETFALLAILSNPKAAKAKLEELLAASDAAKAKFDAANVRLQHLATAQDEWAKEQARMNEKISAQMAEADRRLAQLEAREAQWHGVEDALARREQHLAQLDLAIIEKQQTLDRVNAQLVSLKEKL